MDMNKIIEKRSLKQQKKAILEIQRYKRNGLIDKKTAEHLLKALEQSKAKVEEKKDDQTNNN